LATTQILRAVGTRFEPNAARAPAWRRDGSIGSRDRKQAIAAESVRGNTPVPDFQ
jgi:hypothetical protein